ncbi:glutathione S-transferase family protein [Candidatus Viadribacter manganicus]|uniref:GST N-terminal domain-containing protein n=1 Tax=Candidatus Viadribacter manganicus TaxID=1759059 RepID=A0A1B1AGK5_9PROT|nr:glutathione S-transferase family protein [Candidatus Viadribacter manganicus]ANP45688.1 hypothetical protein ATE48_07010 [Candidatus Viadribacter manganicus]
MAKLHRLHGLTLSYFTGKLEAYLRVKGLAYEFIEMDSADFRKCAQMTGIAQMPQLETPSGEWLTDTSAIIASFEALNTAPALQPSTPLARFFSLLLEDYFDEWLWRPALYYRWRFNDDARLMSAQIARSLLRDIPGPFFAKRLYILHRQRRVFLHDDGITRANAKAVEALFLSTLEMLEPIFALRPYLFGHRPCEADFALFGSVFRHFSHDPTPQDLMRQHAPQTLAWAARLWATTPATLHSAAPIDATPTDLDGFFEELGASYLPYLGANAEALRTRQRRVRANLKGGVFVTKPSLYHLHCLNVLKRAFAALEAADQHIVAVRIGASAALLKGPVSEIGLALETRKSNPTDRAWRH